jgi:hypothetical protein
LHRGAGCIVAIARERVLGKFRGEPKRLLVEADRSRILPSEAKDLGKLQRFRPVGGDDGSVRNLVGLGHQLLAVLPEGLGFLHQGSVWMVLRQQLQGPLDVRRRVVVLGTCHQRPCKNSVRHTKVWRDRDCRRAVLDRKVQITHTRAGTSWLIRGIKGLHSWLQRLWKEGGGYYLGEWHFHPFAAPTPSHQDVLQMKRIANTESYQCAEPILLIIGGDPSGIWTSRVEVHTRSDHDGVSCRRSSHARWQGIGEDACDSLRQEPTAAQPRNPSPLQMAGPGRKRPRPG